ncbi:MAG: hypothetical protein WAT19_03820 [Ferruginibacter sp.]
MLSRQNKHISKSTQGNTVNHKAFFVVLAIWAVTLMGAAFVYFKNKQLSKLSAFVSDYQLSHDSTNPARLETGEEEALLFVKYPNKKLILTKFTGLSKRAVENITIAGQNRPVIISKPKKPTAKKNPDFYIKRVPQ